MPTKQLRAVSQDERASEALTSIAVAVTMSERSLLVAIRAKLAGELDRGVPAHAIKGIASELRDVDRSIRAMDLAADKDEESVVADTDDEHWNESAI